MVTPNQSICKAIVFQQGKGIVRPVLQFHAWVFLEKKSRMQQLFYLIFPFLIKTTLRIWSEIDLEQFQQLH
jgi:hypothetical protein